MLTQDNLYRDAVNFASRLEAEAHPSGIGISKHVFDLINQKIQVSFEDAGMLELKNISRPIQAYYVIQNKSSTRYVLHMDAPQIKVERGNPGSLTMRNRLISVKAFPKIWFLHCPGTASCSWFPEMPALLTESSQRLLRKSGNN